MFEIPESLCSDLTDEQASTVQGGLTVKIKKIQAIRAGADGGLFPNDDDTYMTIDGTKVYGPKDFNTGTTRYMNIKRNVGKIGRIELFDKDGALRGRDDSLGGFSVFYPRKDGRARVSGSGSTYDIFYDVYA